MTTPTHGGWVSCLGDECPVCATVAAGDGVWIDEYDERWGGEDE